MSRYPEDRGLDVPERFWRVYSRHVQDMAEAERWFDLAALHETVWNRKVRRRERRHGADVHCRGV